jgi:hypothetical protein
LLDALGKIDALIAGITRDDVQKMPQAHRQRLAQALRYVADLCDPPASPPSSGVLAALRENPRTG